MRSGRYGEMGIAAGIVAVEQSEHFIHGVDKEQRDIAKQARPEEAQIVMQNLSLQFIERLAHDCAHYGRDKEVLI